jgi:hypothetical protein
VFNDPINWIDSRGLSPGDVSKIIEEYRDAVQKMTNDGKRLPGGGPLHGIFNNAYREYFDMSMYDCADQALFTAERLKRLNLTDSWEFNMVGAPPHYTLEAVPQNKNDPLIKMDPWKNDVVVLTYPPFTPKQPVK